MEELTGAIGYRIGGMIKQTELDAIAGKSGDAALFALCDAYRTFAQEHIDHIRSSWNAKDKNACTEAACGEMINPIMQVLSNYKITASEKCTGNEFCVP